MSPEREEKAAFSIAGYAIALFLAPLAVVMQATLCLPWAILGCFGFSPLDED